MNSSKTLLLGLTGSIGMGKSTTAAMFSSLGVPVWDADSTVHKLYSRNGAAIGAFRQEIPSSVLNGKVNRTALKNLIKEDINNSCPAKAKLSPKDQLIESQAKELIDYLNQRTKKKFPYWNPWRI